MNREDVIELGKMLVEVGESDGLLERQPIRGGFATDAPVLDWTIHFDQREIDTTNYNYRARKRSGECFIAISDEDGGIMSVETGYSHPGFSYAKIKWEEQ